jgi:lipopolysaccharide heptosyltransferase II
MDTIHKTLIIRFSSAGDIVLSTLLIRVLRKEFTDCRIDYLVKSENAGLLSGNPHLSRVITFPSGGGLRDLLALRREIREAGYDLIVDLHDSLRSRFLCWGSSRLRRVRKRKIARFLLVRFKIDVYDRFSGAPPVPERYLETVAEFGVRDDGRGLEVFPSAADTSCSSRFPFVPSREYIGICPGARHATKRWPEDRFAELAATLAEQRHAGILLLGGPDDVARSADVREAILRRSPQAELIDTTGTLTYMETSSLMDRCAVVIANDSALTHIAAARKRPVVALFGSTVRQFGFFPFGTRALVMEEEGLSCRPCTHIGRSSCPLGHFRCMNDITVQRVTVAALSLLAN